MAILIEEVQYAPNPIVAGRKVKATAQVKADEGIASVKLYTPDYRTIEAYDDGTHGDDLAGDGVYTMETDAPYDADAGYYDVTLVVTDKKGDVARKNVQVRIA